MNEREKIRFALDMLARIKAPLDEGSVCDHVEKMTGETMLPSEREAFVRNLEGRGWVERFRSAYVDGVVMLALTPRGRVALAGI